MNAFLRKYFLPYPDSVLILRPHPTTCLKKESTEIKMIHFQV